MEQYYKVTFKNNSFVIINQEEFNAIISNNCTSKYEAFFDDKGNTYLLLNLEDVVSITRDKTHIQ